MFLRTGFTCTRLKSSGNKPEHSDVFMMSVIGLINTSIHAFRSMVEIAGFIRVPHGYFSHFIVCGWFKWFLKAKLIRVILF